VLHEVAAAPAPLVPFKILHGALVLFRRRARLEGAEIAPLARFRICLSGIQPVPAGSQLPDHGTDLASTKLTGINRDGRALVPPITLHFRLARLMVIKATRDLARQAGATGLHHAAWRTKMLVHLPIVILTSLHPAAIVDSVPKFDIVRECKFEGVTKAAHDHCLMDEKQARDQLQKQWAQFNRSDKAQCIEETTMGGASSYVELLTCLEMASDARRASR
jgi:hypothetical protein